MPVLWGNIRIRIRLEQPLQVGDHQGPSYIVASAVYNGYNIILRPSMASKHYDARAKIYTRIYKMKGNLETLQDYM